MNNDQFNYFMGVVMGSIGTAKCFDNWCVNNNIKVYDKCKKCGKQIYVFDMWGTRKDITGYCYKCEQDNKVLLK